MKCARSLCCGSGNVAACVMVRKICNPFFSFYLCSYTFMVIVKALWYLRKSSQPSLMIEGSSCNERKLSLRILIGLRVLTSRRISVLPKKPGRFPPAAGLWYAEEEEYEEESTICSNRMVKDAIHWEDRGDTHCEDLGIFSYWRDGGIGMRNEDGGVEEKK